MAFFRDVVGGWLTRGWAKAAVMTVYAVYLAFACWGVTDIREGLEKRNTANYDSYLVKYYDMEDAYFKKYAFTISVLFSGEDLDFSNASLQQK